MDPPWESPHPFLILPQPPTVAATGHDDPWRRHASHPPLGTEAPVELVGSRLRVVLFYVPEAELRRRDRVPLESEGWTNTQWFDWHQSVIPEQLDGGLVDQVTERRPTLRPTAPTSSRSQNAGSRIELTAV
jgi:hypothetical protein